MKKALLLITLIFSVAFLGGCEYITFRQATTTQVITTLPTKVNGTITFNDIDYQNLPLYQSATYSITNINTYNDIILDTKDFIRHSNIQIVTTLYEERYPFPWSPSKEEFLVGSSSGSGFVFLEDESFYYALTNFHVINPEGNLARYEIMTFSDDDFSTAEVIAYDEVYDLAVVKFLKNDREDITLIDIFERLYFQFTPGELVFAVGNPGTITNNVTFGEFKNMQSLEDVEFKVIYHDATIARGSSGGALVDIDGNLLGVNTWGLQNSDEYSFAVPNYIVYTFLINNGILD